MWMCIYVCALVLVCIYICILIYLFINMRAHIDRHMQTHTYRYVLCVSMYVYGCACAYIHTDTNKCIKYICACVR